MCNAEPVVVNYSVMLRQWLLIIVCYAVPVGVNHDVQC